jgi:hypothetical protein
MADGTRELRRVVLAKVSCTEDRDSKAFVVTVSCLQGYSLPNLVEPPSLCCTLSRLRNECRIRVDLALQ